MPTSEPAAEEGRIEQSESALSARPKRINHPTGAYFADVTAMGTGCPSGTWSAAIDPRGETFTIRFSAYEATVDPGQFMSVKDCQLAIKLNSPQGLSYSISRIHYSGYALLEKSGMSAKINAGYYFMGDPVDSAKANKEIRGPYDGEFLFSDLIGVSDLVWSRCGTKRDLQVPTRMVVTNNRQKAGFGYANVAAVDGELVFQFNLRWRRCRL